MSRYVLQPGAFADLDDIWQFIAGDSIDAADKVLAEIDEAIQSLVRMPHQGHRRSDLTTRPLRFWRIHNYPVAWAPAERPLLIVAVMDGSCRRSRWPEYCVSENSSYGRASSRKASRLAISISGQRATKPLPSETSSARTSSLARILHHPIH